MSSIFDRLTAAMPTYKDPLREIDWRNADQDRPWLPEQMISISGLPVWKELDRSQKLRVSQIEFARLCAAGLWLEGMMIHRVTHRGFVAADTTKTHIILQEVREECGHGLMFMRMIDRAGMSGQHLLGPTRLLTTVAKSLNPERAGFWAMVYLGESITDTFAIKSLRAANDDPICPLAREVLEWHHNDEARHIAAARALLSDKIDGMSSVERAAFRMLTKFLLQQFLRATLFPSLQSLEAIQLPNARQVWQQAHRDTDRQKLANACAGSATTLISEKFGAHRPSAARS
jgi:hypothetical protein